MDRLLLMLAYSRRRWLEASVVGLHMLQEPIQVRPIRDAQRNSLGSDRFGHWER